MEPATSQQPDVPPTPGDDRPRYGAFARLLAVFTSPAEVFRDVARQPTLLVPLVALALVSAGSGLAVAPKIDMETTVREAIAEQGQDVPEDQIEKAVEGAENFRYVGPAINAVIFPGMVVMVALLFFLGLKIVGSDTAYPRILSATAHAWWPPTVVVSVLTALVAQRKASLTGAEVENLVKSDLGAFLSPDAPRWLEALAGSVDVFNVWMIALMIVGFAIVGRVRTGKAAVVVGVLWGIWLVLKVGFAAAMGGAS